MPPLTKRARAQSLAAGPRKRRMKQVEPDEPMTQQDDEVCESMTQVEPDEPMTQQDDEVCESMTQQAEDDENLSNPTQRLEYIAGKALKLVARCVVDDE
eukprot:2303754-Rhodomonas_salina.1